MSGTHYMGVTHLHRNLVGGEPQTGESPVEEAVAVACDVSTPAARTVVTYPELLVSLEPHRFDSVRTLATLRLLTVALFAFMEEDKRVGGLLPEIRATADLLVLLKLRYTQLVDGAVISDGPTQP